MSSNESDIKANRWSKFDLCVNWEQLGISINGYELTAAWLNININNTKFKPKTIVRSKLLKIHSSDLRMLSSFWRIEKSLSYWRANVYWEIYIFGNRIIIVWLDQKSVSLLQTGDSFAIQIGYPDPSASDCNFQIVIHNAVTFATRISVSKCLLGILWWASDENRPIMNSFQAMA